MRYIRYLKYKLQRVWRVGTRREMVARMELSASIDKGARAMKHVNNLTEALNYLTPEQLENLLGEELYDSEIRWSIGRGRDGPTPHGASDTAAK